MGILSGAGTVQNAVESTVAVPSGAEATAASLYSALQDSTDTLVDKMNSLPSLRKLTKYAFTGAQVLLAPPTRVLGGTPRTCLNPQLSCQNTTVVTDLCCFNSPGGQLLQTQFWDTNPPTGPSDSWTIHGLWPDRCDGTYDASCDPARAYTNITDILRSYGAEDTLSYMSTYWKDYQGNDETFWEHEWAKHGTCISTLSPTCYSGYTPQEEVVDFFDKTVALFKGLNSYQILAAAGITPSTSKTYTSAAIQSALTAAHGHPVTIGCSSGAFNEIWYHFAVRGSVQTGDFVPTDPDGTKSTCPATGVKYLPKGSTSSPTTTAGTTPAPTSTTAPGTPFSGKGYLNVITGGSQKGCIISAGTWYTTGTCATITATASGTGFVLSSSKGKCGVVSGQFTCGSTVTTQTVFTNVNGLLANGGSTTFYASAIAAGSTQQPVYTTSKSVSLTISWQGL